MKASVVDLRYKMKDVLKALDRKEKVTILYHGQVKGVIMPTQKKDKIEVKQHPFFAMSKDKRASVSEKMKRLRKPRFNDI